MAHRCLHYCTGAVLIGTCIPGVAMAQGQATPGTTSATPTPSLTITPSTNNLQFQDFLPGNGIPEQQFNVFNPQLERDQLNRFIPTIQNPDGIATEQQVPAGLGYTISGPTTGNQYINPTVVEALASYGGGFSPRIDRGEITIVLDSGSGSGGSGSGDSGGGSTGTGGSGSDGSGNTGTGGGGGTGTSNATIRGARVVTVPEEYFLLPDEARNYFYDTLKMPDGNAARSESERALLKLPNLPIAAMRKMYTPPSFVPSAQRSAFYRKVQQRLVGAATGEGRKQAETVRFAIVVAAGGADEQMAALKSAAKQSASFGAITADAVLGNALGLKGFDASGDAAAAGMLKKSLGGDALGGQLWFVDGAEVVLPNTMAKLKNLTNSVGERVPVVLANRATAKATENLTTYDLTDALRFYSRALEGKLTSRGATGGAVAAAASTAAKQQSKIEATPLAAPGAAEQAAAKGGAATAFAAVPPTKAVVEGVGPRGLITFAANPGEALNAAKLIREDRRFATDVPGNVVVLVQDSGGTKLFLF